MEKKDIAHLIRLALMYKPQCAADVRDIAAIRYYLECNKYLTGAWLPTKKAFKILKKYKLIVPRYKELQEQFNATGVFTPPSN